MEIRTACAACLDGSSTRVGDRPGSPRVAPLPFRLFFLLPSTLLAISFPRSSRKCEKDRYRFRLPAPGSEPHIYTFRASIDGCDHTSTNAPDPIRTPQLSVLGRE
ncbi:hypothetical protein SLEP1_g41748 [Rubroshorea leprosula]|uniref:Uncharacterized protein n=1 Tax=Rubroshorea leprosula TaxID=152421 RepID=A0AAV5L7M1_9ROSI|nr:hypothetical protein SLEP1_g41748 [Rubroshorea leprosula]